MRINLAIEFKNCPFPSRNMMEQTLQRMVSLLKEKCIIKDPRVENAMLKVDRAHYCPSRQPYADAPYSIGFHATISAPHMHAYALEVLKDKLVDGAKVLDVGSGSGYLTACIAHMVGPNGVVYGLDHVEDLVKQSKVNLLNDCGELLDSGRVKIQVADGRIGLPEEAPFDAIHVGATAPEMPVELLSQLKEGGRIVLPVQRGADQLFESHDKLPGGSFERRELLRVHYVPLTDVVSQLSPKD